VIDNVTGARYKDVTCVTAHEPAVYLGKKVGAEAADEKKL
jgi:hypothetical protein